MSHSSKEFAAGATSDDEAPEEVPLSVSRAQAAAQQRPQKAGRGQHKQTRGDRGRESSEAVDILKSSQHQGEDTAAAQKAEEDALPAEVIAALTKHYMYASRKSSRSQTYLTAKLAANAVMCLHVKHSRA